MGRTDGTWAQIRQQHHTVLRINEFFTAMNPHLKNRGAVSLKTVLDKTEKMIILLKSESWVHICSTIYVPHWEKFLHGLHTSLMALSRKRTCELLTLADGADSSWNTTSTWKNDWQAILFQAWVSGRHFLKQEGSKPIPSSAAYGSAASNKTGALIGSQMFWKLKIFLINGNINKRSTSILFKEMFQHLENPHNSVNQYFLYGQYTMAKTMHA